MDGGSPCSPTQAKPATRTPPRRARRGVRRTRTASGPSPEAFAQAILSVLPGFLFQTAVLGPDGVAGFSDAVRTLWPH